MGYTKDNCPKCCVNFNGDPIPEDIQHHYAGKFWRREIGIDGGRIGIYDGIVAFCCPDCKEVFPRSDSTWALEMFDKYKKYLKENN